MSMVHPFDADLAYRHRVRVESLRRVRRMRRRAVLWPVIGSVLCVLLALAASAVCVAGVVLCAPVVTK